jgi:rod shape-determining protein MreC
MYTSIRERVMGVALLLILTLFALVLHQTGYLQPAEDAALGLIAPLLGMTQDARSGVEEFTGNVTDVTTLRSQVKDLQTQVDAMTNDSIQLRELLSENSTLREQLGYKQANPGFDLVGATVTQRVLGRDPNLARVLGVDPSNLAYVIIIDQGSENGVKVGMPVVTPKGLVGRVIQAGAHWSKVLLITDPSSSVNAVVQSTRATGIVQGNVDSSLTIKYVPQGEAIKVGDLILTSGMGGNFPKRLVIGKVTQVHRRDGDAFQQAIIQPSVDFARLEFVLIVKQFTPSDITSEPLPTATPQPKPTRTATPSP